MNFDLDRLQNANVVDQNGEKIGSVGQIYVDDQTGQPTFATVKTGLFGNRETFVPLNAAQHEGDDLRVPYTKDFVKDAPNVDADGHITEKEQDEIYRYYQLGDGTEGHREGVVGRTEDRVREHHDEREVRRSEREVGRDERRLAGDAELAGRDADRLGDDADSMVRREEELRVGKERVDAGRVRLRKHVVTEQKTVNVPVEREEVEVVREPIADGQSHNGGRLGEDEQSVTLHEERPVVEKEVVDKERIGLQTTTHTEQQQVQANVGREEVSVDRDGDVRDGGRADDNRSLKDKAKDALNGDKH